MTDSFSNDVPFREPDLPIAQRDDRQSLLVIADWADMEEVAPIADAAKLRFLGVTGLAEASARLDEQTHCDTLLLFCPIMTATLERLLVQVETQAIQTGMAVVLVAGWDTVDLAFACIRSAHTQLLCDPGPVELAAALVAAGEHRPFSGSVHEVDREALRLQQLSEEVGRLARTIDALTQRGKASATPSFDLGPRISDRPSDYIGMPVIPPFSPPARPVQGGSVSAEQIRDMLRARRTARIFCLAICSLIQPGTCCWICSPHVWNRNACPYRACASPPPYRPRRRCAGSER